MKYDVNGMRVIKECYPNTSDSTIYIYEGSKVVLEMTYEQIPKNKHLFTYAGGKKVSRTSFNTDGTINLDSRKYFHHNFLGSIALITDKDGNIEEHNKFEPFGDIIWSKSFVHTDNKYKFTGKERDKESNLDYFNARYLDTKLGRFMKADVVTGNIKDPQTLNRYVYCSNNPVKYKDLNGLYQINNIDDVKPGDVILRYKGGGTEYIKEYTGNDYAHAALVSKVIKDKGEIIGFEVKDVTVLKGLSKRTIPVDISKKENLSQYDYFRVGTEKERENALKRADELLEKRETRLDLKVFAKLVIFAGIAKKMGIFEQQKENIEKTIRRTTDPSYNEMICTSFVNYGYGFKLGNYPVTTAQEIYESQKNFTLKLELIEDYSFGAAQSMK